jgi:lipid-binding SYLF domain-containing protein
MSTKLPLNILAAVLLTAGAVSAAQADSYSDAKATFENAGQSAGFFHHSYAYALFPNIGGGGFIVGGALGKGRVYVHDRWVGDSSMGRLSAGAQAGAKVYSQIIFFEDKRALDAFESGNFAFSADATAVAVTAAAGAGAGTNGTSSEASGTVDNAKTHGEYHNGTVVFTIAKGGLMYEAAIAGQKFSYTPRAKE